MNFRSFVLVTALTAASGALADVTEEVSYNFTLNDGGRFSLENINGDVTVTGGRGNEVEVLAIKEAPNQEALDNIQILVDDSAGSIRIETDYPNDSDGGWFKRNFSNKGSVTYVVRVPAGTNLEAVESVNGDLEISGVTGVVKASTVNGDIIATGLTSNTDIETVNGTVNANFVSLRGTQKAKCESVNGKLVVSLPEDADASVSAETINGGIDGSDFGLKTSKGFVGRDLEGDIGEGSARLALSTVNGAIKIRSN